MHFGWFMDFFILNSLRHPSSVPELLHRSHPRLPGDPQRDAGDGLGDRPLQRAGHPQAAVQHHAPDQLLLPQRLLAEQTGLPHNIPRYTLHVFRFVCQAAHAIKRADEMTLSENSKDDKKIIENVS